ncbi:hypothetical protein C0583_06505 [Candidatus Parcubacteria bacterium]|nr:MAG: hypothetical protein C0583_06505 [Candidatus Parcubacteria bacterium]
MKNIKYIFSLVLVLIFSLNVLLPVAQANSLWESQVGMGTESGDVGYQYGERGSASDVKDVRAFMADLINIFLGFLGIIFLVLIIYGGFLWMNASGDEAKITKAKSILVTGIIGLVVIMASFAIATFVIEKIYNATLNS